VNPVGGCLPLLIQLPILIALFYVVKIGFSPYQGHIVYDFLSHIDLAKVSTDFYGILNLEAVNATWLPILVGLLQFVQMKLSFSRKKIGVKETPEKHELAKKEENSDPTQALQDPLRMMNKTMLYFMPVMMAFMVATLPSGVGLYLAVSTLFGIAQQFYVNRSQ
jgi:YidC/Oxa1 family membrane protein insertase